MATTRQTDFSAGEVSPLLHSRTDQPWFQKALRSCKNFFVSKQGAAVSRPGTLYMGTVLNSPLDPLDDEELETADHSDDDRAILIPFIAADDESFVLVFQPRSIQLIGTMPGTENRGYIETAPGSGVRYTVTTPYTFDDLKQLHYAQVGEVLTLVCPNWDAYELRHISDSPPSWSFTQAVTAAVQLSDDVLQGELTYADIDSDPLQATTGFMLVDGAEAEGEPGAPLPEPDGDHPSHEWQWMVTAICREDATGRLFETLPDQVVESWDGVDPDVATALPSDNWALYPDKPITLRRGERLSVVVADGVTLISYNIYRGRGGLFGWVGNTKSREFVDVGAAPDYEVQPPQGTDPFGDNLESTGVAAPLISDAEISLGQVVRHYDRAAAVAYFESRRVFAGLTRREADVVASVAGDFDNYDERVLYHIAGESLIFALAARKRGRIRHLIAMNRMVVLTSGASYSGGGDGSGAAWDFDSVAFPLIEEVGANDVTPAVMDGGIFFARAKGRGVRMLASSGQNEGYQGFDVSQLAEHLFRGNDKSVVSMSYAEDPWGVLWVVLEDGSLLCLTFDRAKEMVAWSRHAMEYEDDDGNTVVTGTIESVCCVPEGDEDAVYVVVKRTIQAVDYRYIERFTARHERGGCVLSETDGVSIATPPDYICVDSALAYVGAATDTFTGLDHLEGLYVYVVAQGNPVLGPFNVVSGSITLDAELAENITGADSPLGPKLVAHIGLLYHCELELLDVAGGEARGRNKQVTHVGFEVDNAKGVLVGQDFDTLDSQPSREVADDFGTAPLQTNFFFVPVRGSYDYSARAVLRQSEPLPVTVIGVCRRLDVGDEGGSGH